MRFSVQLPTHRVDAGDEFVGGAALAEMARAAERAGFGACFVTDHPFPGDRWLAGGGHHSLDPFVALAFAAAATATIRVQTHILVLPYRNPFVVAKAAASLDVLSGGRLVLGVAPGYLKSEFQALGADFERRNEVSDDSMRAILKAWTETGVVFEGRGYTARGNTMLPHPLQRPHPPLWVGGNSEAAIRRAALLGDGWVPFPTPRQAASHQRTAAIETQADLAARLDLLRRHAERAGRQRPLDVCFAPFGADMHARGGLEAGRVLEQAAALEPLGVTWMALSPQADSRAAWCDAVAALGEGLGQKPEPPPSRAAARGGV